MFKLLDLLKGNRLGRKLISSFLRDYFWQQYLSGQAKQETGLRKAIFSLSFDCDFNKDIAALPYTLQVLRQYGVKASFACVGIWIEKFLDLHRQLIEEGHEIINHSYSHPDNSELNPNEFFDRIEPAKQEAQIERCHSLCVRELSYAPVGFRAPHFGRVKMHKRLYSFLHGLDYKYSSSTLGTLTPNFGLPFKVNANIIEFPLSSFPGQPFLVFDNWNGLENSRPVCKDGNEFIEIFEEIADTAIKHKAHFSVYFDPYSMAKMNLLERLCELLRKKSNNLEVMPYNAALESIL